MLSASAAVTKLLSFLFLFGGELVAVEVNCLAPPSHGEGETEVILSRFVTNLLI